jgi:hypothetical protein
LEEEEEAALACLLLKALRFELPTDLQMKGKKVLVWVFGWVD